jgi:hypothetical protein|tara:strand:+ start:942 stop:1532 length:591 start_codon:yes stop_codon:yes gene_type:complete
MITRFAVAAEYTISYQTKDGEVISPVETGHVNELRQGCIRENIVIVDPQIRKTFATKDEAAAFMVTLPSRCVGEQKPYFPTLNYNYRVVDVTYTHANNHGYSDVHPYEITRVVSSKTIEIRSMDAERSEGWKPNFVAGGFAGHCTNNDNQSNAWKIQSNPAGHVMRARLQKDGSWKSAYGRHVLSSSATKHHDYNF